MVSAIAPGAAVGQVVPRHAGDHGVPEPHPLHRLRHPVRLVGRQRQRVPRVHLAEAACSRAPLAVDHEGRGAVGPALVDVRAARLLAHGDQAEVVDGAPELAVALADADGHPHPVRLALPDVEAVLGRHPGLAQAAEQRTLPRAPTRRADRPDPASRRGARRCPSPNAATARATNASTTTSMETSIPSAASDVTPRSAMPQGTMWPNMARSVVDVERDAMKRPAAPRARRAASAPRWRRSCGPRDRPRRATPRGTRPRSSPREAEVGQRLDRPPAPGGARAPAPRPDRRAR